jgi:flavin reductase (DIM6/NTAB) family NADH-FMN oxidoreductase RutF/rubredoxin
MELAAKEAVMAAEKIAREAFFKLSYGLFVLTAAENGRDNGCIVNTAVQVTETPARISVAVNKLNHTQGMILRTGAFNVSVLSEAAGFGVFQRFGFKSGRDADKFASADDPRAENGVRYVAEAANAVFCCKVAQTLDCGTHSLFIADVTQAFTVSDTPSATYRYYFEHIKPKPQAQPVKTAKKAYVCKICGYIYEGEELPAGFICPLCKHGAEAFEEMMPEMNKPKGENAMKYECVCGYVYDETVGDPERGIAPGTKWADVPEDYECPVCGAGKSAFSEQ